MTAEVTPLVGELVAGPGGVLTRHAAGWLLSVGPHTRRAYRADLTAWALWCSVHDVDQLSATRGHVDAWKATMAATPTRYGRPPAQSTIARRVSAVASWYSYLVDEQVLPATPVHRKSRPKTSTESTTVGLSLTEARALVAAAELAPQRDRAAVLILLEVGLRVAELVGAEVTDLGFNRGHRVLTVLRKGGFTQMLALPPDTAAAVDAYLQHRADQAGVRVPDLSGPLLLPGPGSNRVTQQAVFRLVRRIARAAGIASWSSLSPHSLRHTCATLALDSGASLRDVQDLLGHASPTTTNRYDRARRNLDRSPSYVVSRALAA